jgi:acetyl-CoA carboxylase biotin carboxyl carrier protein
MLKIQEIRELIKLIDKSTIDEFEYEEDGAKISLKKSAPTTQEVQFAVGESAEQPETVSPQSAAVQKNAAEEKAPEQEQPSSTDQDHLHKIESPMVGTFYSSPSPDNPSYVKAGDKVSNDSVVCIIEAMKLFNEIEAEINGEIVEILVENGELVEYGQPLFLVKPE